MRFLGNLKSETVGSDLAVETDREVLTDLLE